MAGLNFAVPIDTVLPVIRQLVKHGKVTRNYLGMSVVSMNPALVASRKQLDPSFVGVAERGLLVTSVSDHSPAAKAGLVAGDIVLQMDGVDTNTFGQMFDVLGVYKANRVVRLLVQSGTKRKRVKLTPTPLETSGASKKH